MHNQNRHTILGSEYLLSCMPQDIDSSFCVIDGTYGKGLHSKLILDRYPNAKIIAFDYDKANLYHEHTYSDRLTFVHSNFINIGEYIQQNKIKVDIIMLDLGTHMDQILNPKYGLSFMDATWQIDMRVDNSHDMPCASTILHQYNFKALCNIFKYYGNIPNYAKIANNIIEYRRQYTIEKVSDLYAATGIKQTQNKQQITKVCQALRIAVNHEIKNLVLFYLSLHKLFITKEQNILLISFTFHSLEDKIVKNVVQNKLITYGLENMFNDLDIVNFKALKQPVTTVCSQSNKKIYTGEYKRRKDLFFIIRSTVVNIIN